MLRWHGRISAYVRFLAWHFRRPAAARPGSRGPAFAGKWPNLSDCRPAILSVTERTPMADAALADAPALSQEDLAQETGFDSLSVTAQDGLRLHVRRYGTAAGRRLPIVCLPGLTRNGADFH